MYNGHVNIYPKRPTNVRCLFTPRLFHPLCIDPTRTEAMLKKMMDKVTGKALCACMSVLLLTFGVHVVPVFSLKS